MTQVMNKDAADMVCVMLEVHIWSGRRHLDREELVAAHPALAKLPSQSLATLGAYKICDPDDIKAFQRIKGRADRYLRRVGLPILGAWGIPAAKFAQAHDELAQLQAEFTQLQDVFLRKFDVAVEKWIAAQLLENPDYGHLFHRIPTRDYVERKLAFLFHAYRIAAPAANQADEALEQKLNGGFADQVGGLKGALLKDVAAEATQLVEESLFARDRHGVVRRREYVTPRTLGPLRRAAAKLSDFRFLDASIGPLADMVADAVNSVASDRIEGASLMKVCALATLLSNPAKAVEVAQAAMDGAELDSLLGVMDVGLIAVPRQQASPAPAIALLEALEEEELATAPMHSRVGQSAGLSLLL